MAKLYSFLIFLTLFMGIVVGGPVPLGPQPPTIPTTNYTFEEIFPFPSCSMNLTAEQVRSGIIDERYRWSNGFIVHPERGFTSSELNIINDAIYDLAQILCIPVLMWPQDSNPTGDYVEIIRGAADTGCSAQVGRIGGMQRLNLAINGCIHKYIVIHEAIHALGYYHEQSRPDRDSHVNILWTNITPGKEHNFDIRDFTTTFNVPYDLASIMHYESHSFSSNGRPTVVRKNGDTIPRNTIVTANDVQKLRRMYNC